MAKTEILEAVSPADYAAFREVLNRYNGFLLRSGYVTVSEAELRESTIALAARYAAPDAAALVARSGQLPIGIAGLRRIDPATAELRRLHVVDGHERAGVGTALVLRALDLARALHYRRVVLGTTPLHEAAVALYRRLAFREIPRFAAADAEDTLFMARDL